MTDWQITGADGEPILGTSHEPEGKARAVALVVHGFLGYKDYGMFPRLASELCAGGVVAHRFNLSHSGMTRRVETFERPELFEHDTWNKQAEDIGRVIGAVDRGELGGQGLPVILVGHSRGGVSVLLCAGRRFESGQTPLPRAVVTLAAPDATCMWDGATRKAMLERGFSEVTSGRTGQTMRIDAGWLREQVDDPRGHDLLGHVRQIGCPMLVIHGEDDPTVANRCGRAIADAGGERARLVLIEGANHVFNTPNPLGGDEPMSEQLAGAVRAMMAFIDGKIANGK